MDTNSEAPRRIKKLPVDSLGLPIPRFAQRDDGKPDFRNVNAAFLSEATRRRLCWICGEKVAQHLAFVIGPMAAVNRTSGEPPCHRECALFAVERCPHLRMLAACAIWMTRNVDVVKVISRAGEPAGVLFKLGVPTEVMWFSSGRPATRSEVENALVVSLPSLLHAARQDPDRRLATRALRERLEALYQLMPREVA